MIAKKIAMKNVRLSSFIELVSYLSTSQGINNRVGKIEMHNFENLDNNTENLNLAVYDVLRVQDSNKRTKSDKTYHLIVSFADGENLSDEQLSVIEQSIVEALGYKEHQRISVVHRDTDNLHFHVAINKIHPTTFTYHEPYKDYKILGEQCRKFEIEFGLKQVERGTHKKNGIDMEEMSGMESLIGWIRRNISDSIKKTQSWEEMHIILKEHGLILKKRGNGFVIGNGDLFVKASSVDRELSKAQLEKKLGEFKEEENRNKTEYKKKTEYEKKPFSKIDTSKLYAEYELNRVNIQSNRTKKISELKAEYHRDIKDIKSKYDFRLSLAKHSTGLTKYVLMKMLIHNKRNEIEKRKKKFQLDFKAINKEYKKNTWADWLKKEAAAGNKDALHALRNRGKKAVYKGNQFNSTGKTKEEFADLNVDNVTKKGTVIYEQDNFTIRDTGKSLKLGSIPEDKAVEKALDIALKKYGNCLDITGTKNFREKVVRIAAAKNLDVSFTDIHLNKSLERYKQEYEHVRKQRSGTVVSNGGDNESGINIKQRSKTNYRNWSGKWPARYRRNDTRRNGSIYGAIFANKKLANSRVINFTQLSYGSQKQTSLRRLSKQRLVYNYRRTEVLLPSNVFNYMVKQRTNSRHSIMRRDLYRSGRELKDGYKFIKNHEAVVGLVAKPGSKPPSFRKKILHSLANLQHLLPARTRSENLLLSEEKMNQEAIHKDTNKPLDSVEKYIKERLEKKEKGFDIMKHRRYNANDAGRTEFIGLRQMDGDYLGLFKSKTDNEIIVMALSEYAWNRLSKLKRGSVILITKNGQIHVSENRTQKATKTRKV